MICIYIYLFLNQIARGDLQILMQIILHLLVLALKIWEDWMSPKYFNDHALFLNKLKNLYLSDIQLIEYYRNIKLT